MKKYLILEDFINTRFDRWFKKNVFDVPQSLIEKNLRKGNFKINNKKNKSSYKLQKDDFVTVNNFNFKPDINKKQKHRYIASKKEISSSSKFILENNENFVVINKPSGIAVQSGTKTKKNIIDILRDTKEFKDFTPFTVHRIDKETTGVMIVAKNRKYAQLFTSLFRIRKIHKTYLGIVIGSPVKKKGTLVDDLVHYEKDEKMITKAITKYEIIDTNNKYSLLKLNPETGRKHQLRKQLLLLGCPIFGDDKYRIVKKNISKQGVLMLHAYKLNFSINNIKYSFSVEPPLVFKNFLKEKYLKTF
jgi:23S rRNA pseudouridine955/2504/2580 synthase